LRPPRIAFTAARSLIGEPAPTAEAEGAKEAETVRETAETCAHMAIIGCGKQEEVTPGDLRWQFTLLS
jgi:hypothetical protein